VYSYYKASKNTEDIAYFSTVVVLLVVLFFHFATFASIFLWDENTIKIMQIPKWQRLIYLSLFIILPFYLLIQYFFPESEILKQMGRESNLNKGRLYSLGYIVFSIALFLITVWTVKGLIFQ
jgi:hypothetical protein